MSSVESDTRDIRHKALRQALKVAFPACVFSVRGSRGTGYGWTRIGWTDGPTDAAVRSICWRYFGSSFNSSTDGYDSTGGHYVYEGITHHAGGSGFNTHRTISRAFAERLLARVVAFWGGIERVPAIVERAGWGNWTLRFEDDSDANYRPIRPELENQTWYGSIHECAEHRDRYTHTLAATQEG